MGTLFIQTLWESLHRRIAPAMLAIAALVALAQCLITFETDRGVLWVVSGHLRINAAGYVSDRFHVMLTVTSQIWPIVGLFAVAPLLSSYLEKGWAELLFAKGVARWEIVTARFAGAFSVFLLTLLVLDAIPAAYLAFRSGTALTPMLIALLVVSFSFVSYMALMLLVSSTQPNPTLLIGVAFVQAMLSTVLAERKTLYGVITWKWVQWLLDWAYRILPKNSELNRDAVIYLDRHSWSDWWAVWTTALFIAAAIAWSFWRIHRRPL